MLDKSNHAKVADFGLSIVKSSSASHSRSGGGRGGAGTLPWMAPELHDDQSNSKETDVYSLGVVLWEIVSRKLPYAGLTAGQMISKTLRGQRDAAAQSLPGSVSLDDHWRVGNWNRAKGRQQNRWESNLRRR